MSQRIIKIILLSFVLLLISSKTVKAEYCQWTNVQTGLYCSTELKDINWQEKSPDHCSGQANNLHQKCCCIAQQPKQSINQKYIIIAILVIIFGGLTGYFLVIKNNGINIKR